MPSLVVIFGRDRGRHFDLSPGGELVIGRDPGLIHRLNDRSISREHIELIHHRRDNKCFVHDMRSRNGARVNGKKLIHTREIRDGDIIQVGYTLMVYVCVTFDAKNSVVGFLNDCERAYEPYLQRLRDHAAMHVDPDPSAESKAGMSGTMHLSQLFGRKRTKAV